MPNNRYKTTGSLSKSGSITVLDENGNLDKKINVQGDYELDNLSISSGILFATTDDGDFSGYGKVNFSHFGLLATGGDIVTYVDNDKVHIFNTAGTKNFELVQNPNNVPFRYLVIGGGGGGAYTGSGGGAGGYVHLASGTVNTGSHQVIIGTGGAGSVHADTTADDGGNSSFNNVTASGGGGGLTHGHSSGRPGGCGSGAPIKTGAPAATGGTGLQGGSGGAGYVNATWVGCNAGGGGAGQNGSAGGNSSGSGKGGDGLANDITGISTYYAGGGGGGEVHGNYVGAGGLGGGGSAVVGGAGGNGTNGLGGGGAGGSYGTAPYYRGGNGGSGTVIIRYPWNVPKYITSLPWTETFTGATGDFPNELYWGSSQRDKIQIYENKLRITNTTLNSYSSLASFFKLAGNFDVEVEITMVTAPSTNIWSAGIYAISEVDGGSNRFYIQKAYSGSTLHWGAESLINGVSQSNTAVQASYTGKLRLVRQYTTITCYYDISGSWIQLHTRTGFPVDDVSIHLNSGISTNTFTTRADFDNFKINSGTVIDWA